MKSRRSLGRNALFVEVDDRGWLGRMASPAHAYARW
jgi:hypothetical protein